MGTPAPRPAPEALVWKALADATRRQILDELRRAPLPTGRLAERFAMTRFGVMKHLKLLQEAGLVVVEERGRERWNHLNPVPIRDLYRRWIRPFEEEAADRLLSIKRLAEAAARNEA
jgi:DNA-binding transcriptional ArsR family regulator